MKFVPNIVPLTEIYYQDDPDWESLNEDGTALRFGKHHDHGFTMSISGFLREAKKYAWLVMLNQHKQGYPYTGQCSVNIEDNYTVEDHRTIWKKVTDKLSAQKVSAVWVREIDDETNLLHYHLLFKNLPLDSIHATVSKSLYRRDIIRYHVHAYEWSPRGKDQYQQALYFFKGRKQTTTSTDHYKRVLFKKGLFVKTSAFGTVKSDHPFWVIDKEQAWADHAKDQERVYQPNEQATVLAQQLNDLIDDYNSETCSTTYNNTYRNIVNFGLVPIVTPTFKFSPSIGEPPPDWGSVETEATENGGKQ